MTILTRDEIAAALCLGALEPDARTLRQADAVLSLLASKSETPETAKYPLKATKEMLDAAEISWNRSYEYEPYRFEKMLNAALAVVAIPLAESEQRGDRCAYVYRDGSNAICGQPAARHIADWKALGVSSHAFLPPVSPMPPLGDAAERGDGDFYVDEELRLILDSVRGHGEDLRDRRSELAGWANHIEKEITRAFELLKTTNGEWIRAEDVNRLARELDVAWNGAEYLPERTALCDIVAQIIHEIRSNRVKIVPPAGDAAGSEDADLKAMIAEAREAHKKPCPHMATRCCTSCYGNRCEDLLARLIDALEARESPLPSPAESLPVCDCGIAGVEKGETVCGWCRIEAKKNAGPAPSVEPERCRQCGHKNNRSRPGLGVDKNLYGCADDGQPVVACGCDDVFHFASPATIAPSPVDTMVSAAGAFEKMPWSQPRFQTFAAIARFMRACIASHPACEDRKAK